MLSGLCIRAANSVGFCRSPASVPTEKRVTHLRASLLLPIREAILVPNGAAPPKIVHRCLRIRSPASTADDPGATQDQTLHTNSPKVAQFLLRNEMLRGSHGNAETLVDATRGRLQRGGG